MQQKLLGCAQIPTEFRGHVDSSNPWTFVLNEQTFSVWKPQPDELDMLNAGGFILVSVDRGWDAPRTMSVIPVRQP